MKLIGPKVEIVVGLLNLVFPGGLYYKESVCNSGDPGSIPGSGRSPGEGSGNLLQYSCYETSMDRGAWWATAHGVAKSCTQVSDLCYYYHLTKCCQIISQSQTPLHSHQLAVTPHFNPHLMLPQFKSE